MAPAVFGTLRVPRNRGQVPDPDLNCSESALLERWVGPPGGRSKFDLHDHAARSVCSPSPCGESIRFRRSRYPVAEGPTYAHREINYPGAPSLAVTGCSSID